MSDASFRSLSIVCLIFTLISQGRYKYPYLTDEKSVVQRS